MIFFSTTKSKLCQNLEFPFMFEQIPCISKSKLCIKKSKPWIFTTNKFWFSFYFGVPQSFISCSYSRTKYSVALTLSGMGQGTLTLIFLLDQILSADFFSKISKLFWMGGKLRSIGSFWHPAQLLKSYKSCPDPCPWLL